MKHLILALAFLLGGCSAGAEPETSGDYRKAIFAGGYPSDGDGATIEFNFDTESWRVLEVFKMPEKRRTHFGDMFFKGDSSNK